MLSWVRDLHAAVDSNHLKEARKLLRSSFAYCADLLHVMDNAPSASMVNLLYKKSVPLRVKCEEHLTLQHALWRKNIGAAREIFSILADEDSEFALNKCDAAALLRKSDAEVEHCLECEGTYCSSFKEDLSVFYKFRDLFEDEEGFLDKKRLNAELLKSDMLRAIVRHGTEADLFEFCVLFLDEVMQDSAHVPGKCAYFRRFLFFRDGQQTRVFEARFLDLEEVDELQVLAVMNENDAVGSKFVRAPSYKQAGSGDDVPPLIVAIMLGDDAGALSLLEAGADVNALFCGQSALILAHALSRFHIEEEMKKVGALFLKTVDEHSAPAFQCVGWLHAAVEDDRCADVKKMQAALDPSVAQHLYVMSKARSSAMVNLLHEMGVPVHCGSATGHFTLQWALRYRNADVLAEMAKFTPPDMGSVSPLHHELARFFICKRRAEIERCLRMECSTFAQEFPLIHEELRLCSSADFAAQDKIESRGMMLYDKMRAIAAGGDRSDLYDFCRQYVCKIWSEDILARVLREHGCEQKFWFFCRNGHTEVFAVDPAWEEVLHEMHMIAAGASNLGLVPMLLPKPVFGIVRVGEDIPVLIVAIMLKDWKVAENLIAERRGAHAALFLGHSPFVIAHYLGAPKIVLNKMLAAGATMHGLPESMRGWFCSGVPAHMLHSLLRNTFSGLDESAREDFCRTWEEFAEYMENELLLRIVKQIGMERKRARISQ